MATKKVIEKKTGEKYASKAAMAKHEKKEGKAEQIKEYGKPKGPIKQMKYSSPIKQARTPEEEKLHKERLSKMTPADHAKIKAGSTRPPVRGRKEAAAGPMQLKSVAKMKKR